MSEDLPDGEIAALKDRVKKLEDPDNELVFDFEKSYWASFCEFFYTNFMMP